MDVSFLTIDVFRSSSATLKNLLSENNNVSLTLYALLMMLIKGVQSDKDTILYDFNISPWLFRYT